MGKIGCLGEIAFEVSSERVLTTKSMKWSGAARYGKHAILGGNTVTEFLGNDAEKITLSVVLSAYLGVNPMQELEKIIRYRRTGAALPLVIGEKAFGRYRWNILSHDATITSTDDKGNALTISVNLTLQEKLKEGVHYGL